MIEAAIIACLAIASGMLWHLVISLATITKGIEQRVEKCEACNKAIADGYISMAKGYMQLQGQFDALRAGNSGPDGWPSEKELEDFEKQQDREAANEK